MVKLGIISLFMSVSLIWLLTFWQLAFALYIPAFLFALSNGICIPNLTSISVGLKPEFSGTASGLMGVAQLGTGVVLSSILGVILKESAVPLFAMIFMRLLTFNFIIADYLKIYISLSVIAYTRVGALGIQYKAIGEWLSPR